MTVTDETYEEHLEPRYVVIIRGAVIVSVALANTVAGAQQMAAAYQQEPETEVVVKPLPLTLDDRTEAADLLEAMTRLVNHVHIEETVRVTATVETTVAPIED